MGKGKIVVKNKDKNGKRKPVNQGSTAPSKKRKTAPSISDPSSSKAVAKAAAKPPKKIKTSQRATIDIPSQRNSDSEGSEDELDDEDMEFFEENNVGLDDLEFLENLDKNGISRSKKETLRLKELDRRQNPAPSAKFNPNMIGRKGNKAPSIADTESTIDSEAELEDLDEGDEDSDLQHTSDEDASADEEMEDSALESYSDDEGFDDDNQSITSSLAELDLDIPLPHQVKSKKSKAQKDQVEAYEAQPRKAEWNIEEEEESTIGTKVGRLPIKLPGGVVQKVEGTTLLKPIIDPKVARAEAQAAALLAKQQAEEDSDSSDEEPEDGAGLGTRFGRLSVASLVTIKNPAERKAAAKEQIASLGSEILGGGELVDNLPLIHRLFAFTLPTIPNPKGKEERPIPNPTSIRALGVVSMLAVFKDLIPGYKIRELTETEEQEKVRDEVKRLREGEKGLVRGYALYLKMLEKEIKIKSPLSGLAVKCMCDLLSTVPHFNFRDNIMAVLVGRLSRKSWSEESESCLQSVISLFQNDIASEHSLPLVRLLARMIKEKKFAVNPKIMTAFWYVKVKGKIEKRETKKETRKWDKDRDWKKKAERGKGIEKGKEKISAVKKEWRTKKMRKDMRDRKVIERDMDEAEAEVDFEEAARNQTETLQHLFVLYFSILKAPVRSPLLPSALEGLARFAHLVNIDFFRDLLKVLRGIIIGDDSSDDTLDDSLAEKKTRIRLLGVVTAFELLTGQGEALNIDLNDFINYLYALIPSLAMDPHLEDPPSSYDTPASNSAADYDPAKPGNRVLHKKSQLSPSSDLLFRALHLVFFSPYASHAISPPWRAAAFSKRLVSACMYFPPKTAISALEFVRTLIVREPKVESLLSTEDRTADGIYRPDVDDPQLSNPFAASFWELGVLEETHWDEQVRTLSAKLARYQRE